MVDCLPKDGDQFRHCGCLLCGGPLDARPGRARRPGGGTKVEVRPAGAAGGPNLALADVCEEGAGLRLRRPLTGRAVAELAQ